MFSAILTRPPSPPPPSVLFNLLCFDQILLGLSFWNLSLEALKLALRVVLLTTLWLGRKTLLLSQLVMFYPAIPICSWRLYLCAHFTEFTSFADVLGALCQFYHVCSVPAFPSLVLLPTLLMLCVPVFHFLWSSSPWLTLPTLCVLVSVLSHVLCAYSIDVTSLTHLADAVCICSPFYSDHLPDLACWHSVCSISITEFIQWPKLVIFCVIHFLITQFTLWPTLLTFCVLCARLMDFWEAADLLELTDFMLPEVLLPISMDWVLEAFRIVDMLWGFTGFGFTNPAFFSFSFSTWSVFIIKT